MSLESATFISQLDSTNPTGGDQIKQGDDHIRMVKSVLQTCFPNADKAFYFPDSVTKSANYTILAADVNKRIIADATAAGFNLTLPTLGASDDGWSIWIIKSDSTTNAVTIVGTVNGSANPTISVQYQAQLVIWSGSAWFSVGAVADPTSFVSKDAGASAGPTMDLFRDSASPAVSDFLGKIDFNGRDSAANKQLYGRILAQITDPVSTTEDAILILQAVVAGTLTDMLKSNTTGILIPGTLDITGNTAINTNKLTVDAATGNTGVAGLLTISNGLTVTAGAVTLPAASVADAALASQPRKLLATLTASNSATLSDVVSLTATYAEYELVFERIVPATTGTTFELQIHSGGAFKTTGYIGATNEGNGVSTATSSATTFIQLSHAATVLNAEPGLSGRIRIRNPSVSAIHVWEGTFGHVAASSLAWTGTCMGFWNTAGVIDGFQVLMSSGNITSGTVKIYGLS